MKHRKKHECPNYLLIAILAVLMLHFFPTVTTAAPGFALAISLLSGCYWLIARFPSQWKQRKPERLQSESDNRIFWEYDAKHNAIRARFDPANTWNEATSLPREYLAEIHALNLEYKDMLQRRNGWIVSDFREQ